MRFDFVFSVCFLSVDFMQKKTVVWKVKVLYFFLCFEEQPTKHSFISIMLMDFEQMSLWSL